MAEYTQSQLATVTARDGVDTRTKENSAVPCEVRGGDNLSVEAITGVVGQTAAMVFDGWLYSLMLPDYIVPMGAEVIGSVAWAAWENWKARMSPRKDDGYCGFSGYDDTVDHKETLRELAEQVGPNSALFTQLYCEFYNDAVAGLKSEVEKAREYVRTGVITQYSLDYHKDCILREIAYCKKALDDYYVEMLQQKFAANKLVRWYTRLPPPGVRVSETGTWIADDDDEPAKERAAFLITSWMRTRLADIHNDRIWRDMHIHTCQGCRDDHANNLAHMHPGGCLGEPVDEEDQYIPCRTCDANAFGSDYRGYCSRECRYS